jgi:hypothetical protein
MDLWIASNGKKRQMRCMKKTLLLIAPVLMLSITACGPSREQQAAEAEKAEEAKRAEALKALPPTLPISEQGTYRCADNTIVKVDFLGTKEAASIVVGTDAPVRVDAPKGADGKIVADRAMKSADGATTLAGGGDSINLTLAGKGAQSCKK